MSLILNLVFILGLACFREIGQYCMRNGHFLLLTIWNKFTIGLNFEGFAQDCCYFCLIWQLLHFIVWTLGLKAATSLLQALHMVSGTHDTASMVTVSSRLTALVSPASTNPRSSIFWILVSGQVVTDLIPWKLRSDTDVNLYYLANSNISICLSHAQSWIESDGSAIVTYDFFIISPDLIIWRVGSVMFITFPWIVI